jgi:hypothetical protein
MPDARAGREQDAVEVVFTTPCEYAQDEPSVVDPPTAQYMLRSLLKTPVNEMARSPPMEVRSGEMEVTFILGTRVSQMPLPLVKS